MCGLAGEVRFGGEPNPSAVRRMLEGIRHRGPDAEGLVSDANVALGHRRLAIIDLSTDANQPMRHAATGALIVYNGELYNFIELRHELRARGVVFKTASDTEVLLEAYIAWGPACVDRFNGMFAFAIWDPRQRVLFAARDRLGEKPFYYAILPCRGLAFASELSALATHPAVGEALDPVSVGRYLACGYTLGERTILQNVRRLPPASTLTVSAGRAPVIARFWDLAASMRAPPPVKTYEEAVEAISALIDESVRMRMISDVPIGAFLSGGVDSSILTAAMARSREAGKVDTFSIGFSERTYSELPQAREVATHLGVHHRDRIVAPDTVSDLEKILTAAGEPFADSSIIPTFHLAEFARKSVTVALSGDGGDELFAGYETYIADQVHGVGRRMPRPVLDLASACLNAALPVSRNKVGLDYKVRQFFQGASLDFAAAHWSWRCMFDDKGRRDVLREGWAVSAAGENGLDEVLMHQADVADQSLLRQAAYIDIKTWLCDDVLVKVDRATMAHSLESRAPLLDHRLAEFAMSIPDRWKLRRGQTKRVLKSSAERRLPKAMVHRKKRGFNAPVSHWMTGAYRDMLMDCVSSGAAAELIEPRAAERLLRESAMGIADHGFRLFNLLCLGVWLNRRSPSMTSDERVRAQA